jgi:hypothetical protein
LNLERTLLTEPKSNHGATAAAAERKKEPKHENTNKEHSANRHLQIRKHTTDLHLAADCTSQPASTQTPPLRTLMEWSGIEPSTKHQAPSTNHQDNHNPAQYTNHYLHNLLLEHHATISTISCLNTSQPFKPNQIKTRHTNNCKLADGNAHHMTPAKRVLEPRTHTSDRTKIEPRGNSSSSGKKERTKARKHQQRTQRQPTSSNPKTHH